MQKFTPLALVAALALATPVFAANLTTETVLGTSLETIKASLTDMGYEVRKMEVEDGMFEAYIVGENDMGEIYVDMSTGIIRLLKMK